MERIIAILVIFAVTQSYEHEFNNSHNVRDFYRRKRQDAPWVWGSEPVNSNLSQDTRQASMPVTPGFDLEKIVLCKPYEARKPEFRKPDRRISTAKCLEYVWEMKNREDAVNYDEECVRNGMKFEIHRLIIGGKETEPGEFPHMGALGWLAVNGSWIFKCGGTLISSKFVLTAGHCSRASRADTSIVDPFPKIVRLGDKNIKNAYGDNIERVNAKISNIIVHPEYAPPSVYFDIALVELADQVTFTKYVQPACLWDNYDTTPLGKQAIITGWGYTDTAVQETTAELQAAIVDIVDSNLCNELLRLGFNRNFNGIQPHQICAGVSAGGIDSCQGDSGGPLQKKLSLPYKNQGTMSYVIGVTSFGFGCARANKPGVYTRVSSVLDWIENIVWS